jgi:hypothetical protein
MEQLHEGVWVHQDALKIGPIDGTIRMTVVRLASGGLWVHSPTPLSQDLKSQIDDLGPVTDLVAPNNGHNLYYQEWILAYPHATRHVAKGIPGKLPQLTNYHTLNNDDGSSWPEDFEMEVMEGVPFFDECAFLHKPSASLILTDFVQNHRGREYSGFGWVMNKLVMEPIGFKDICLAPPLRFGFMIKDRPALNRFVSKVLAWDFDRIIVTHGDILEEAPGQLLQDLCKHIVDA